MIEQGVINLLLGTPTPTDAARALAQTAWTQAVGQQVFPAKAAQGVTTYPYATVSKVGADHKKNTKGRSGLAGTKILVRVYHRLYGTGEEIAETARQLLDGYRGPLANDMSCQGIFQEDDSNQWERPVHSDEQGVQAVEIHLKVWANES